MVGHHQFHANARIPVHVRRNARTEKGPTDQARGNFEDLDRVIASRQQEDPAHVFGYLPLMYYRAMLTGKSKLRELHNDRYPDIRPITVAQYVKEEGL